MANTIVRVLLPSGLGALTLKLYSVADDTLANGAGDALTEDATILRRYSATVAEAITGEHYAVITNASGTVVGGGITEPLADDVGPYWIDRAASQASVDELAGDVEALTTSVTALSGTDLSNVSPVGTDGDVTVYRARDYANDDGLALEWVNSAGTWPDLTGATIHVRLGMPGCSTTALYQFTGSAPTPSGANQTVRLELTDADLSIRPDDYTYNVVATLASGNVVQLYTGSWSVLFALEAPAA